MSDQNVPDILKEILEAKRLELERAKVDVPISELERLAESKPMPLNFAGALTGSSIRIISEIKRSSPTKGVLRSDMDVAELASIYVNNGAAAISVLTNSDYFDGSLADLDTVSDVAHKTGVPVLRKEFIFDPYQVLESHAHGADAILLIVAMLSVGELIDLKQLAEESWMQVLVEVHDENELEIALDAGAEIIGINNRDLRTFVTDIATTERLAQRVPDGKIIVGESGIHERCHLDRIADAGANAALIGEALVTASEPGAKLRSLV